MMKRFAGWFFAAALGALSFAAPARSSDNMPEDLAVHISSGLNSIHQLDFDEAERQSVIMEQKYPGRPYGPFGMALTSWARLEYQNEQSDPALEKMFEEKTEAAVKAGDAWIKNHPDDPYGYWCSGAILGMRSRLYLMKHRWVKSYFTGKKAIAHMWKAIKLDPHMYDAYLGPGMYEYYVGTLSGTVGVLAKLFIHGDPVKGIEYLNLAADKGRFNNLAARLILIEIYTQTGTKYSNPQKALEWIREIRVKYPNHPLLHFVELVALHECKKWDVMRAEAQEYVNRINSGAKNYNKIYLPRVYVALGTSYFAEHKWPEALAEFKKAADSMAESGKPNRWGVWALAREAQVYDIEGKRDLAIATYKKALSYQDQWGLADYIKPYLSKKYDIGQVPGQLPPP